MSKDCDYLKWYVVCPTTTVLLTGAAAVRSIIYGGGINSQRQPCPCPCPFLCPSSSGPWLVLFWITRPIVLPRPAPRCPCPFLCPSSSSCPWLVLFWITRPIVLPRPAPHCPCPFLCPSSSSCPWLVLFWITRLIVDPRPGPRYVDQESKVLLHEHCQQTNEHGESYASLQTYQLG